jgi:hypothetical protein
MVIHEKLVLPDNLPAFAPIWAEFPRQLGSLFSQLRQETALRLLRENRMKMMATREDVFGQRSNHRARS